MQLILLQFLFFISGFSALVYQVAWQRALFTVLGSNSDSTSIIIAIFMLGLGLGAIFGGQIAARFSGKSIFAFSLLELFTGLYGFVSLYIIHYISHFEISSIFITGFYAALALLLPTLFMGATLPILVTHLNKSLANTGGSVATLYFVNTLGAGIASLLTVFFLFELFGLQGTVNIAASLNLVISCLAWLMFKRVK